MFVRSNESEQKCDLDVNAPLPIDGPFPQDYRNAKVHSCHAHNSRNCATFYFSLDTNRTGSINEDSGILLLRFCDIYLSFSDSLYMLSLF